VFQQIFLAISKKQSIRYSSHKSPQIKFFEIASDQLFFKYHLNQFIYRYNFLFRQVNF